MSQMKGEASVSVPPIKVGPSIPLVLDGSSGDVDQEHKFALQMQALFELWQNRHADYGPHNIGIFGEDGILVRMTDKFVRLNRLLKSGAKPRSEAVEDTWRDIAVYATIALQVRSKDWPESTLEQALEGDAQ